MIGVLIIILIFGVRANRRHSLELNMQHIAETRERNRCITQLEIRESTELRQQEDELKKYSFSFRIFSTGYGSRCHFHIGNLQLLEKNRLQHDRYGC